MYSLNFKKEFVKLFPDETTHDLTNERLDHLLKKENLELSVLGEKIEALKLEYQEKLKRVERVNTVLFMAGFYIESEVNNG